MEASIDFTECVLTEVLAELMNGLPSSSRLADLLVYKYNVFLLHRNLCMCVYGACGVEEGIILKVILVIRRSFVLMKIYLISTG